MMYFAFLLLILCGRNSMAKIPLIDLSHTYYLDPPTSHKINVLEKSINRIQIEVDLYQMCSSEHAGTHIEAPITFSESGLSVDEIPFKRLWRVPGVLMDVSADISPGNDITSRTFDSWKSRTQERIPDGGILLIYTGFSQQDDKYMSNERDEETSTRLQPRLTEDAADWLVKYAPRRGHRSSFVGVGIDLDSLDNKDSNETTSARFKLYSENIYALHNLRNLNMLSKKGFLVTVMPMKINKGTGAPARVFAEPGIDPIPGRDTSEDEGSNLHSESEEEGSNLHSESEDEGSDWHSESEEEGSDWDSESDHRYPNPYWRIAASAESSYCFNLMSLFCLLTIQYFWLKVVAERTLETSTDEVHVPMNKY